jgi:hypothetical protein
MSTEERMAFRSQGVPAVLVRSGGADSCNGLANLTEPPTLGKKFRSKLAHFVKSDALL